MAAEFSAAAMRAFAAEQHTVIRPDELARKLDAKMKAFMVEEPEMLLYMELDGDLFAGHGSAKAILDWLHSLGFCAWYYPARDAPGAKAGSREKAYFAIDWMERPAK